MSSNTLRAIRDWELEYEANANGKWLVSRCHNRFDLRHAEHRAVFGFNHPTCDDDVDKRLYRERVIEWEGPEVDCELHGFLGSFTVWMERQLASGAFVLLSEYSIVPDRHTPNLHAWYPVFFALPDGGVMVKKGEKLKLWMARRRNEDASRVWYEWRLIEPVETPVQNLDGSCYTMGTVVMKQTEALNLPAAEGQLTDGEMVANFEIVKKTGVVEGQVSEVPAVTSDVDELAVAVYQTMELSAVNGQSVEAQ